MNKIKTLTIAIILFLSYLAVMPLIPSTIEKELSIDQFIFERTLEVSFPDNFIPQEHFAINNKTYERQTQQSTNTFQTQSGDIDYLILTDETFWNSFNEYFRDWKIENSDEINSLEIVNTSTIYADPDTWVYGKYGDANPSNPWIITPSDNISLFNDSQCKIRNFIRKYVTEKNTSYILLAGNRNYLPVRMATTYGHSGPSGNWYNQTHASDMYYSNLNYSMNNNSNNKWMENKFGDGVYWATISEWDEIDWEYDVLVGRVLIDSEVNCLLWINKTKNYVESNDANYNLNGMVATKDVSNNINDYVWTRIGDEFSGNINFVNGQNISQAQWNIADDYCNGAIEGWGGIALIYHSGHGGTFWTPYQPNNLNNSLIPNFMYTEACHSANFGSQTSSRMEQWMKDDGGVFAGISNSAYGWFIASTWYGEEMMSLMFNETRGVLEPKFCKAHFDSRENVGWELHSVAPMIFKSTNFFGDPSLIFNIYEPSEEELIFVSNPNPANGSTNQPLSLNWSVNITDSDGDLFNWSIECSNGQNNNASNDTSGTKSLEISGLEFYIEYIIWVNASNEELTYNAWFTFITKNTSLADITTLEHNRINDTSALLNGFLNDTGGTDNATVWFEWGATISYGNRTNNQTIMLGAFNDTLTNLSKDIYHYRAVANNGFYVSYGEDILFWTTLYPPWDINQDGVVNYLDISILVSKYGWSGNPGWIPEDINSDGEIDYLDVSTLVSHYVKSYL